MFVIFDLDGTVIDSSHRKAVKPDGTLDLDHWRENSTPQMIAKDKLLPLAYVMRGIYQSASHRKVIVCTARVMGDADYWYLAENDLQCHALISRPPGCRWADPILKHLRLRDCAADIGVSWNRFKSNALMFDDAPPVIQYMNEIGIRCIDAAGYNAILPRHRQVA